MKFIHSYEAMFETMVATLFKFMCMHFDLFHNRDQIKLSLARIYSREMATIFVSNISILLHPVMLVCADLERLYQQDRFQ